MSTAARRGLAGLLALALVQPFAAQAQDAAAPAAAPAPAWTLARLSDDPVPFHGMVNMDSAGLGSSAMVYPTAGLGVIGLLVGVATHAAVIGGRRSAQEDKLQAGADRVLDPYRASLAQLRGHGLQQRALALTATPAAAHLGDAQSAAAGETFVEIVPLFALTPDATAMVLDETVVVRASAKSDKGVQQVIRVASTPRTEADLATAWNADDGAALTATAARLMAQSLDLALRWASRPADDKPPLRTLRYGLGGNERMERGQLLEETCDVLVIRTLRGALLVVPHKAGATLPAGCPAAPAN